MEKKKGCGDENNPKDTSSWGTRSDRAKSLLQF